MRGKNKKYSTTSSRPQAETSAEYAKRQLVVDNTRDYSINSDSDDDEPPNFDYLLKLSSTGSHFLLKSEQERFNQDLETKTPFSSHFNLDTNVLSLAFKSIPFDERHAIANIEWGQEELNQMQKAAEINEEQFRLILQNNLHKKIELSSVTDKVESLKLTKAPVSSSTAPVGGQKDKESIQQWLDDILEI